MLQNGATAANGYLSDQQIAAQMSVLNSAFTGVQVIFVLAGVQRITNHPEWWCALSFVTTRHVIAPSRLQSEDLTTRLPGIVVRLHADAQEH